ncbi:MAG: hypothetical protein ABI887_03170 [Burkholderiales bacterium]
MNRLLLLFAALVCSSSAYSQATKFEGAWNVTMVCPPHNDDDEAKGYTHRFRGEVAGGEFSATHGQEGEPGWHFLRGQIKASGNATLRLDGIVNNPRYAINDAPRGKQYSYRVKAHFDETSGSGQRLTGRVCEFTFSR